MKFDKSKVYTLLNADEVKEGSKGYFADNLEYLKDIVEHERGKYYDKIDSIEAEGYPFRFRKKISIASIFSTWLKNLRKISFVLTVIQTR